MASLAMELISSLYNLNRNFCSDDYENALAYINNLLPLDFHVYNKEMNGWSIPPKWDIKSAQINFNGKTLLKVTNPIQLISLSKSYKGKIDLSELKKHLVYDHRDPNAIPYHFRQNYRPWERTWGFCVTKSFFDSLEDGLYDVEIATKESEGYIKVASHRKQGLYPETFSFVAHLDHPGMANDDLAGVAVGVELFKRLSNYSTKFSYQLVLVQEVIGSVYYLSNQDRTLLCDSCFLEMLGSKTPLALQKSARHESLLEKKLKKNLEKSQIPFTEHSFRSLICNDEAVWESYGIPMASLSRFPYPEYHSHKDNPSIINENYLNESIEILLETICSLDKCLIMEKKFEGVLALAHPKYNLYVDPGQPAFGGISNEETLNLRLLMDWIPMFPKRIFVDLIADTLNLPLEQVINYLKLWEEKDLLMLK